VEQLAVIAATLSTGPTRREVPESTIAERWSDEVMSWPFMVTESISIIQ
jgi:hypothetical protein